MPLEIWDRLRSFPLFADAPDGFLMAIARKLRPQFFSPQEYILTEGEDARAMYWIVRGAVVVTSRDGESVYAELSPGAFFGEIGILFNRPRTASILARTKCMVVVLTGEALSKVLPQFPEIERAIREEAQERLNLLAKQKALENNSNSNNSNNNNSNNSGAGSGGISSVGSTDASTLGSLQTTTEDELPSIQGETPNSRIAIRDLLRELPLFATLPADMLHTLALSVEPKRYSPFEYIIRQDRPGRELFFVVAGEVEVIDERTQQTIARLPKGSHFGEVTFLSLAEHRTASVRSVNMVDCLVLTNSALQSVVGQFPEVLRGIEQTARERMMSSPSLLSGRAHGNQVGTMATITEELQSGDMTAATTAAQEDAPIAASDEVEKPLDPDPFSHTSDHLDGVGEDALSLSVPLINGNELLSTGTINQLDLAINPASLHSDGSVLQESSSSSGPSSSASSSSSSSSSRPPSPGQDLIGCGRRRKRARRGANGAEAHHREHARPRRIRDSTDADENDAKEGDDYDAGGSSSIVDDISQMDLQQMAWAAAAKRAEIAAGEKFPDSVLVCILKRLPLKTLMRLQRVNRHWLELIRCDERILRTLDLREYNTSVYDNCIGQIASFVGQRPRVVDISNCFHLSDAGFAQLVSTIGRDIRCFRMRSVWEVSGLAIMELTVPAIARTLEEIDLSNCRKVGDATLARVVGWVVPDSASRIPGAPPAGTIVGCPKLKRISLSYCKHITDKSMHHLAMHASDRLEALDLTRCTTVTDVGFGYWSQRVFPRLRRLCLADCTFLTDKAIVSLAAAAKALEELDLSFCCALSDVSVEVLSLGCPHLKSLNLGFCGSAVSDASLRAVARHLIELRVLSVRGCVRVTNAGVEAIGSGCVRLETLDLSQCRNVYCDAHPLDAMTAIKDESSSCAGADEEKPVEMRAGGSGRTKTYGYGCGLWKGKVRVIF